MSYCPPLIRYTLVYRDRKPTNYSIDFLEPLEYYVLYEMDKIRQIVFRFEPKHHPYYFPYSIHLITLQSESDHYRVVPHHYYDHMNQLVTLEEEQQYTDYYTLYRFLRSYPVLKEKLLPYVIPLCFLS